MSRVSLSLMVAGGLLVLGASVAALFQELPAQAGEIPVPDHLGPLSLSEQQSGASAADEIARLHGKTFPLASAVVARYGPNAEATLWLAGTSNEVEAAALIEGMRVAIARGDSPFTPLEPRLADGDTVYPLLGMGQEHMYFRSGRLVVWLAADPDVAEAARLAVLEAYR